MAPAVPPHDSSDRHSLPAAGDIGPHHCQRQIQSRQIGEELLGCSAGPEVRLGLQRMLPKQGESRQEKGMGRTGGRRQTGKRREGGMIQQHPCRASLTCQHFRYQRYLSGARGEMGFMGLWRVLWGFEGRLGEQEETRC